MRTKVVQGVSVPAFLYGTAWKEANTEELTRRALSAGFRGIDTANQRRHYVEAAIGEALASMSDVARGDVFLQTKFTYAGGQDHRIPYDPAAPAATQVQQSFESSLEHLKTTYVDCYVLHGPSMRRGLSRTDWEVWAAMETLHGAGQARLLGASNVTLDQIVALTREAKVKPAFVQNRCFANMGWDRDVRRFCSDHGIVYQAFSLLTANPQVLSSPVVQRAAERVGGSAEQVVFRFALQAGMLPLTGTSSERHMQEDLACFDLELEEAEVAAIEHIAG